MTDNILTQLLPLSVPPQLPTQPKKIGRPRKPPHLTYQYTLTRLRGRVSTLVKHKFTEVSGLPSDLMSWMCEEQTGLQKNLFMFGLLIENWPGTFEAPGHISSVPKLQCIVDGLESGAIAFRQVSSAEVARIEQQHGLLYTEARRARRDTAQVRDLRPLDTRSKRLRKGTVNKTRQWVTEYDDRPIEPAPVDWAAGGRRGN